MKFDEVDQFVPMMARLAQRFGRDEFTRTQMAVYWMVTSPFPIGVVRKAIEETVFECWSLSPQELRERCCAIASVPTEHLFESTTSSEPRMFALARSLFEDFTESRFEREHCASSLVMQPVIAEDAHYCVKCHKTFVREDVVLVTTIDSDAIEGSIQDQLDGWREGRHATFVCKPCRMSRRHPWVRDSAWPLAYKLLGHLVPACDNDGCLMVEVVAAACGLLSSINKFSLHDVEHLMRDVHWSHLKWAVENVDPKAQEHQRKQRMDMQEREERDRLHKQEAYRLFCEQHPQCAPPEKSRKQIVEEIDARAADLTVEAPDLRIVKRL